MKKIITLLLLLPLFTKAQHSFTAVIKNQDTKEPVQGATVQIKSLKLLAIANDAGVVILNNLPNGKYDIEISNIGYKEVEKTFVFPLRSTDTIQILLEVVQVNWAK